MKSKTVAKKSAPTKKSGTGPSAGPLSVNASTSANIRKIENGFLVTESGTTGKGRNQTYWDKSYYSPTNPLDSAKAKVSFSKKK